MSEENNQKWYCPYHFDWGKVLIGAPDTRRKFSIHHLRAAGEKKSDLRAAGDKNFRSARRRRRFFCSACCRRKKIPRSARRLS